MGCWASSLSSSSSSSSSFLGSAVNRSRGWPVSTVTRIGCVWDEILMTVDGFGGPVWEKCAHLQGFGMLGPGRAGGYLDHWVGGGGGGEMMPVRPPPPSPSNGFPLRCGVVVGCFPPPCGVVRFGVGSAWGGCPLPSCDVVWAWVCLWWFTLACLQTEAGRWGGGGGESVNREPGSYIVGARIACRIRNK